jgi:hypothetical protein
VRFFHRHTFDPDKWKLVSEVGVMRRPKPLDELYGVPQDTTPYPVGNQRVYSNTCKGCGDLAFRRVKEIE